MSIPNWYELILLALAAWRTFQLIAQDEISTARGVTLRACRQVEGRRLDPEGLPREAGALHRVPVLRRILDRARVVGGVPDARVRDARGGCSVRALRPA